MKGKHLFKQQDIPSVLIKGNSAF
ncbi:hypothetical protein [Lacibacter sp. H375]